MRIPPLHIGDKAVTLHGDQVIHGRVEEFRDGMVVFVTPDGTRWWMCAGAVVPDPEGKECRR